MMTGPYPPRTITDRHPRPVPSMTTLSEPSTLFDTTFHLRVLSRTGFWHLFFLNHFLNNCS